MARNNPLIALLICALPLVTACSSKTEAPPPPTVVEKYTPTERGAVRQEKLTVRATVDAIDEKERMVTLKRPDGTVESFRAGREVRNLDEVRRGDWVVVTYYRSAAFEVVEPGTEPSIAGAEGAGRAELGDKPGGIAARMVTLVAKIKALDREARLATLEGPDGKIIEVDVQRPENFDKVKVGDTIELVLTEAFAIDVQHAPN